MIPSAMDRLNDTIQQLICLSYNKQGVGSAPTGKVIDSEAYLDDDRSFSIRVENSRYGLKNCRHEVLNELNRQEVIDQILSWI